MGDTGRELSSPDTMTMMIGRVELKNQGKVLVRSSSIFFLKAVNLSVLSGSFLFQLSLIFIFLFMNFSIIMAFAMTKLWPVSASIPGIALVFRTLFLYICLTMMMM